MEERPRTTDFRLWTLDFGLWTLDFRLHVADVSSEREEAEEGAEDVFAFADPGDRFDVQRMQSKESGDKGAAPKSAGHLPEEQEDQDNIGDVKNQVGQVHLAGAAAEELVIEHVGNPSEGMPVAGVAGGERPAECRQGRSEERRVGKECRSRWSPYP